MKILFFDIETTPLKAYIWRCGKQRVNPGQLVKGSGEYDIICIAYCWNDGKPAKILHWGYHKQDSKKMIAQFDKLVLQADIVIGKNSDRFDVKHINTLRLKHDLPPVPDWNRYTEDLEKKMRKYLYLPSYSLDYFTKTYLDGKGKIKMEFDDWIDILEKRDKKKFLKMLKYNKKDVIDTRNGWNKLEKHVETKLTGHLDISCKTCKIPHLYKNGTKMSGGHRWQRYYCSSCGNYAGRVKI